MIKEKSKFYTYIHCKPNGEPFYIGKGTFRINKSQRCNEFKSNRNNHYKNIVAKYGKENILVFVFPCESEEQAFSDEMQQIKQLKNEGYKLCNQTKGGEGKVGCTHSKETRLKISLFMKGNKYALGYVASDELRKKRSENALGNKKTLGFKHSAETKAKMSIGHKKKILHLSNHEGMVNKIYQSIDDASKELNLLGGAISRVCSKKYKHTKGNVFCYL